MMSKYVTMVQGPVVGVVQGDGAEVYIGTNQVIVNGRVVYPSRPRPWSQKKCRAWDKLNAAEDRLRDWPLDWDWWQARERLNQLWERFHEME